MIPIEQKVGEDKICPKCGAPSKGKFCQKCGMSLEGVKVQQIHDPVVGNRKIDQQSTAEITKKCPNCSGQVKGMFCSFCGTKVN